MQELKLEKVSPTLSVYQSKGVFSYGTDAVLLVKYVLDFYKNKGAKKMCDLCSGTGIIPLMLCDSNEKLSAFGAEINKEACEISSMSAKVSGLSDRYTQIRCDIKDIRSHFAAESFDFVTCNPPYMTSECGYMCEDDYKTIARHEILCNIDDVFRAAFYLLPTGGNAFIVYRTDRLSSLFSAAKSNRFEIKEMTYLISSSLPSSSKLVVCRAMKDSSEGLKVSVREINEMLS